MQTFFGQIYRVDKDGERVDAEEDGTILWVGRRHNEIKSVYVLATQLRPRAEIPSKIYGALFKTEVD
jgi:hypothetical protein